MVASPTTAETESAALGLLIFDGDCGFCTTAARKFGDFADGSATVMPWQALQLDEYGLTESDVSAAAFWVQNGNTYRGADAIARCLQACRSPWSAVGTVMAKPPVVWLARLVYPIIAKYRHRLPGATNACRIG